MTEETVSDTHTPLGKPTSVIRSIHIYFVAALIIILSLTYYADYLDLKWLPLFDRFFRSEYLHDLHRALFLIPMLYAAVIFRFKGAVLVSVIVLGAVLPRAIFISPYPDAELRTVIFVLIASLATVLLGIEVVRREREKKISNELKNSTMLIKTSQKRYRDLFNSASDAILIRDLEGNIIEANKEATVLTGYSSDELMKLNISQVLSADSYKLAIERQQALLEGRENTRLDELELIKKDGTMAIIESVPILIIENGQPVGFQSLIRDITEQKKMLENMQFYISEITNAQEDERKRIARELHDETAQSLATLLLDIEALSRSKEQLSDEETRMVEQLRIRVNTVLEGVRSFAHELRPPVLDQVGLVPALELLVQELNEDGKIKVAITIMGNEYRLSSNAELALFRIAQEALRNVRKHSQATEAVVKIEFNLDMVRLTVTDNGLGFELPEVLSDFAGKGKLGMLGMQERVRLLGGNLSVDSRVGEGTTVSIEIENLSDKLR